MYGREWEEKEADWQTLMDRAGAEQMHKDAFRLAFNLFKECWPPEDTVEYYSRTGDLFAVAYNDTKGNPLAHSLLHGVFDYLEFVARHGEAEA